MRVSPRLLENLTSSEIDFLRAGSFPAWSSLRLQGKSLKPGTRPNSVYLILWLHFWSSLHYLKEPYAQYLNTMTVLQPIHAPETQDPLRPSWWPPCCSCAIPTSPRQAVSVEDAQLVSKFILQNATERQQHKLLFFSVSCIGNINIIFLSI